MPDAPALDRAGGPRAYVTLVTNADYLPGVVALLNSLARTGTEADTVVLHTGGIDPGPRPARREGRPPRRLRPPPPPTPSTRPIPRRAQHARAPFTKGEKPAFHTPLDNFAKLRLWQLLRRVVFLDRHPRPQADRPSLRLSRVLRRPERLRASQTSTASTPASSPPARTQRPSPRCSPASTPRRLLERTDQTFLEAFFPDWQGLPVYDNLLQYVWFNLPGLGTGSSPGSSTTSMKSHGSPASQGRPPRPADPLWRAFRRRAPARPADPPDAARPRPSS